MHLKLFQKLLDDYSIVPEDEKQLSAATEVIDPVKKRALKVAQYKKDSELKSKIAVCLTLLYPLPYLFHAFRAFEND